MDQTAAGNVAFDWAISPADGTHKSVPAYMAGKPFSMLHRNPKHRGLPEEELSLAEALRPAGFTSFLWTANEVLSRESGLHQGFHQAYQISSAYSRSASFDEVLTFIQAQYEPTDGRELIYIHLNDVHLPYIPPAPFDRIFREENYRGELVIDGALRQGRKGDHIETKKDFWRASYQETEEGQPLDDAEISELISLYDGAIRYVDNRLPVLLDALDFSVDEDMLIITADHGEQFFEQGYWGHYKSTLTPEIRVPLIIAYSQFQSRQVREPASLMDIYPTLCEMYDVEPPPSLQGRSLLSLLQGGPEEERFVYSEGAWVNGAKGVVASREFMYQIHHKPFYFHSDTIETLSHELYYIEADPLCTRERTADFEDATILMNSKLRQLNPAFAEYTIGAINNVRPSELGRNLLSTQDSRILPPPPPSSTGEGEGEAVLFVSADTRVFFAEVEVPGSSHVLDLDYVLHSGTLEVAIRYPDGERVWRAECRLECEEPKRLRAVVTPYQEAVEVEVTLSQPGAARIEGISFCRLKGTFVPLRKNEIGPRGSGGNRNGGQQAMPQSDEEELTTRERLQLEALGYL